MELSEGQRHGLNTALSEAHCLGIEVDAGTASMRIRLEVLTLPVDGPPPADRIIDVVLDGVGRVAASLREQRWDDVKPRIHSLTLDGLNGAVQSFDGGALHGWEFIDLPDSSWAQWGALLSFDTTLSSEDAPHVLELSQEEGLIEPRELDLRVWFADIRVEDRAGCVMPLEDFIAGGVRWWQAHDCGDPRTIVADVAPPL